MRFHFAPLRVVRVFDTPARGVVASMELRHRYFCSVAHSRTPPVRLR
jgi:hypothetical protein